MSDDRLTFLGALEKKALWLGAWMIHNANHLRESRDGLKVGGHQASSASLCTIMTALYGAILRPHRQHVQRGPARQLQVLQLRARQPGLDLDVLRVRSGQPLLPALPAGPDGDSIVDGMDHARVERLLMREVLGLDPGDKRIVYVGGDYPPAWLRSEVDSGRAEAAVLIAPVRVDEFVAVNLARQKMPRKSTWFTPKARGGLVLAELAAEG